MLITRFVARFTLISVVLCLLALSFATISGQTRRNSELAFIETQTYGDNIRLIDVDRERSFPISGGFINCSLSWSPDAQQLAFAVGNYEVTPHLFIFSVPDRQLNDPPQDDIEKRFASWSPDGQYIVYQSYHNGHWQLSLIHPDGSNYRLLQDEANITSQRIVWFADSQRFLVGGNIFNINNQETISFTPDAMIPVLSPDNTQIVYQAERDNDLDIYLYDLNTQQELRLTDSRDRDANPIWSPDGSQIAFISERDGPEGVWLMDSRGENQHPLFTSSFTDVRSLAWSPDGSRIAFAARDTHPEGLGYIEDYMEYNLYLINADGTNLREIFEGYSDYQYSFSQYCGLVWRP